MGCHSDQHCRSGGPSMLPDRPMNIVGMEKITNACDMLCSDLSNVHKTRSGSKANA